jgi:sulfur-oxidizing protein SoxY
MTAPILAGALLALPGGGAAQELGSYAVIGDAIPRSLTGAAGDAARGRALVVERSSTCILCHSGPFPEQKFQGDLAPDLSGSGSRASEGQLRLRLVDASRLNAASIMPSYYRVDGLNRVGTLWRGKPILSAEEIEDIVAYLGSLREEEAMMQQSPNSSRRQFLGLAGGAAVLGALPVVIVRPAEATPAMLASAIQTVTGGAAVQSGKVKLDIPPLVENGNTVPMTVTVAHPMAPEDHVTSVHVFNEKNPQPNIANFHLSPQNGRAQVSTRIRLADSQKIVAIAKLSDGSFWSASVDVVVTLAACTEEVI